MILVLCILCVILGVLVIVLAIKLISVHRAAEELRREFGERISQDTNVGIDISSPDKKMKQLAADMDRQLKLLRKEHIRYTQGDRELKNAVTNISHDLRTPLTAICGYMNLLSQEEVSDTVREFLSVIDNRIQTMKELTEELFRYSVILSVDTCDVREDVSLNRALEECMAAYYGALVEKGIKPVIQMPGEPVIRKLNGQALSRILSNIVSNVLKYSDGDLFVVLDEEGIISFSNHASGMDELQVGHLFDRFFTVESGQNATGLGLSIAKTLTEDMDGKIDAGLKDGILKISVRFRR